MNIHTLENGTTILVTSPGHGFKFSDNTVAQAQEKEVCDKLTCERVSGTVRVLNGMNLNETRMVLSDESLQFLKEIAAMADLILVPFMVLNALREQGMRGNYPNVVAFNATTETQRSAPADKIIDIGNWSY